MLLKKHLKNNGRIRPKVYKYNKDIAIMDCFPALKVSRYKNKNSSDKNYAEFV